MLQTKVERDGLQLTVPLISNTCLRLHVPPQNWSFSNSQRNLCGLQWTILEHWQVCHVWLFLVQHGPLLGNPHSPFMNGGSKSKNCFFAITLLWMASYGSERNFLLIFSARYDLVSFVKIGRSEVSKPSLPPYFDLLSESSQRSPFLALYFVKNLECICWKLSLGKSNSSNDNTCQNLANHEITRQG